MVFAGALGVAGLGAWYTSWLIESSYPKIADDIEKGLNDNLGSSILLDGMRLQIFPRPHVAISNLIIHSPKGYKYGDLFQIEDIKVTSSFIQNFSEGFIDLTNSITNILRVGNNKSKNYVYEATLYQLFVEELNRLKNDNSKILPYLKEIQFDNLKKTLANWKMTYAIDK